ncbi:hypothetical protein EJB05_03253, partial [Eragrostis curvula]
MAAAPSPTTPAPGRRGRKRVRRALAQPTTTPSRSSSLLRDGEAMGVTTVAGVDPVVSTAPGLDSPSIMLQAEPCRMQVFIFPGEWGFGV